ATSIPASSIARGRRAAVISRLLAAASAKASSRVSGGAGDAGGDAGGGVSCGDARGAAATIVSTKMNIRCRWSILFHHVAGCRGLQPGRELSIPDSAHGLHVEPA